MTNPCAEGPALPPSSRPLRTPSPAPLGLCVGGDGGPLAVRCTARHTYHSVQRNGELRETPAHRTAGHHRRSTAAFRSPTLTTSGCGGCPAGRARFVNRAAEGVSAPRVARKSSRWTHSRSIRHWRNARGMRVVSMGPRPIEMTFTAAGVGVAPTADGGFLIASRPRSRRIRCGRDRAGTPGPLRGHHSRSRPGEHHRDDDAAAASRHDRASRLRDVAAARAPAPRAATGSRCHSTRTTRTTRTTRGSRMPDGDPPVDRDRRTQGSGAARLRRRGRPRRDGFHPYRDHGGRRATRSRPA
jgi:hypothetical protein